MRRRSKLVAKVHQSLRGNLRVAECPSRSVLDHVTSRWGALVLLLLREDILRFSELARGIGGVSEKMLTQTLRSLEGDGFLVRTVYPTRPPKVEYRLTRLGEEVALRVESLTEWVEDHTQEILAIRSKRAGAPKSGNRKIAEDHSQARSQ